jgi:hypothetical protein
MSLTGGQVKCYGMKELPGDAKGWERGDEIRQSATAPSGDGAVGLAEEIQPSGRAVLSGQPHSHGGSAERRATYLASLCFFTKAQSFFVMSLGLTGLSPKTASMLWVHPLKLIV